jgi:hypothetical protein
MAWNITDLVSREWAESATAVERTSDMLLLLEAAGSILPPPFIRDFR